MKLHRLICPLRHPILLASALSQFDGSYCRLYKLQQDKMVNYSMGMRSHHQHLKLDMVRDEILIKKGRKPAILMIHS